jgi:hypothetical protein
MDWKLIVIPLITTILTTIVLYAKENMQNKNKRERTINEEKLKGLYNELFSISLIHAEKLENSFYVVQKGMFEQNGESIPEQDVHLVHNKEMWDELIIKIRQTIHNNLHLLEEDDLALWHSIELSQLGEHMEDKINIYKYKQLEEFLDTIIIKYKSLYKKYHR